MGCRRCATTASWRVGNARAATAPTTRLGFTCATAAGRGMGDARAGSATTATAARLGNTGCLSATAGWLGCSCATAAGRGMGYAPAATFRLGHTRAAPAAATATIIRLGYARAAPAAARRLGNTGAAPAAATRWLGRPARCGRRGCVVLGSDCASFIARCLGATAGAGSSASLGRAEQSTTSARCLQ